MQRPSLFLGHHTASFASRFLRGEKRSAAAGALPRLAGAPEASANLPVDLP